VKVKVRGPLDIFPLGGEKTNEVKLSLRTRRKENPWEGLIGSKSNTERKPNAD